MKKALILFVTAGLLYVSCKKENPITSNEKTKLGNPLVDTIRFQNRVDGPVDPAPNYVTLAGASVTSYTVEFTWIWGIANKSHGGGGITLANITIVGHNPGHGFAATSIGYTTYPGSTLVTVTISGHITTMSPTKFGVEIVNNPETVYVKTVLNVGTSTFNMEVTTKK